MDVALLSEGTYPHSFGGVSVWCDQLVRGMANYDFHLVALVGTGFEQPVWELPDNVASVVSIPLWNAPSAGHAPGRRARRWFRALLRELIDVLLDHSEWAQLRFGDVLREVFQHAQTEDLGVALRSEEAVRVFTEAWQTAGVSERKVHPKCTSFTEKITSVEHSCFYYYQQRVARSATRHSDAIIRSNGLMTIRRSVDSEDPLKLSTLL
jgi:hypothetical protein